MMTPSQRRPGSANALAAVVQPARNPGSHRGGSLQLYERFLAGTWQRLLLGRRGTRDFIRRLLDAATFEEQAGSRLKWYSPAMA